MKHKPLKKIPKLPKLSKPTIPKRLRRSTTEERTSQAINTLPRITNETVAEHREEVLSSARKYIYPLQHSKHRIVIVSTGLLVSALIAFFAYSTLELYRFQSTSGFLYRVTQVFPFPVAKAGSSFVAYENYLFELRRYIHYYQTQQRVDFGSTSGKQQLARYKPQALQQVIDDAYVKQLASKYHVSVSDSEVNDEISLLRSQNQLGSSNQELSDVTNEFFGWSVNDLKRELKQELLAQKVVSTIDTATHQRAIIASQQIQNGADFGTLASQASDDASTKGNGGQYADKTLSASSTDVPPQVLKALVGMKVGEVSNIINTGSGLEIVKVLAITDGKIEAAHITFQFKPLSTYVDPLKQKNPAHIYISANLKT